MFELALVAVRLRSLPNPRMTAPSRVSEQLCGGKPPSAHDAPMLPASPVPTSVRCLAVALDGDVNGATASAVAATLVALDPGLVLPFRKSPVSWSPAVAPEPRARAIPRFEIVEFESLICSVVRLLPWESGLSTVWVGPAPTMSTGRPLVTCG